MSSRPLISDSEKDKHKTRDQLLYDLSELRAQLAAKTKGLAGRDRVVGMLDGIMEPILVLDDESQIVYANSAAARLFTRDSEAIEGMSLWEVYPKGPDTLFFKAYERARKGRSADKFRDINRLLGKWFEVCLYPAPGGMTVVFNDVTVSQQIDELQRLALSLLHSLRDNVFLLRADGRLFHMNKATKDSLGYSGEDFREMSIFDVVPPSCEHEWHDILDRIREHGSTTFESRLRARDGRELPVEVHANYIELYGQKYYAVAARIITERKRAEEALKKSEVSMARAQSIAHVGSWELDLEANTFTASDEAYRIFGGVPQARIVSFSELLGFVHPDDVGRFVEAFSDARENKRNLGIDFRIVGKDGVPRVLHGEGNFVYDDRGDPVTAFGTIQDITELKWADEALRESEEKYRFLVENSKDIIWKIDSRGCWTFVSGNVDKVLGYQADEVVGKTIWDFLAPECHKAMRELLSKRLRGEDIPPYEGWIISKDGHRMPFEVVTTPILDSGGAIVGIQGISRDITHRKRAEEALRESEERFRQLSESLPQLVWTCRADGPCDYLGPQWINYTGIPADVQLGYGWLNQVHPEDRERVAREWASTAARGEPFDIEFRIRRYDGVYRWFKTRATPIRDTAGNLVKWFGSNTDIDDMKRAVEALRDSEEKFRVLAEASSAMIWLYQGERFIYVNSAGECLTGYPIDELLGMRFWDVVHPDDRDLVRDRGLARQRGEPVPSRYEVKLLTKGGETRWVELTAGRIEYRGEPAGIATFFDVTERKRAEDARRKSQYILAKSQEMAHVGNWAWNVETGEMKGSDENYHIYGYEPWDVRPNEDWTMTRVHPDDRAQLADIMQSVKRDGMRRSIDYRIVKPDGDMRYIMTIADKVVRDRTGKIKHVYGITQDITERKRAEEALRESEKRYRGIVEDQTELICLFNGNGTIIFVNDAYCRYFGRKREELVGHKFLPLIVEEDREAVNAKIATLSRENPIVAIEQRVLLPEGGIAWHEWKNRIIFDEHGNLVGYQAVGRDITDRKRAEEAQAKAKAQAELYLDLMGHDINNMHQIILGYLELARDMQIDRESVEFLDKPIEVLQRSAQLIKNVRKLQKLNEGMFQYELVDVTKVLVDVQREFGAVPNKSVTLNMNGREHCHVRANELLHDVFANLVSNAIKHTGDRADIVIDLDVVDNGGRYCRVSVEDNGPGISDDFKGKIFYRMLKGTDKAKGMGLGLYLVKSLVESYDGKVWIEDRIAGDHTKGAKFVVMLPAVEQ